MSSTLQSENPSIRPPSGRRVVRLILALAALEASGVLAYAVFRHLS